MFFFLIAEKHELDDGTSHNSSFNKNIMLGLCSVLGIMLFYKLKQVLSYYSLCVQCCSINNSSPVCGIEFVLCLDASDAFLKDRVMNLPERLVQEQNYEPEHFLQRLARYRENNVEDETVVNYFDELDITPLYLGNP